MHIPGEWFLCDDRITRPVLRGEVRTAHGGWEPALFMVDTGADRTVFSAALLAALGIPPMHANEPIGGIGGLVDAVVVETQIRFPQVAGAPVLLRGRYAACTSLESLDMSVLGRDIMGLFAVIVDQPQNVVCLLGQRHYYTISKQ